MKVCTVCRKEKPLTDFYNRAASEDGKAYRCKSCDNKAVQKYRKENSDSYKKSKKAINLKHKYGISEEDHYEMMASQEGRCKICLEDLTDPQVDHCHSSGKVRGLLCRRCNMGLGHFKDNVQTLENAIKYLKEIH